ncbi:hypothetical protein [Acidovorax sp. A1169]|uniref:hypothetical protein n=1 Tax=Acidovorax sp. A1169 TaxID=3059524 RepID=UPI00273786B3|nr:hypothetical protein [Acidovorax sp. A1169]MDP4078383.1 hypothetical protein [Acidovorax sp. A1169]
MTTPSNPAHRPAVPGEQPAPTSGKENSKAMWYVVGMVAIAVAGVIGFNVMGPKGNAGRMGESAPPAATSSSGSATAPAMPTASSPAQAGNQGPTQATPQSADTPVDASRDTMGAPAGATLPSTDKSAPAQASTSGAVPMQATAPASDVPASPASR